MSKNDKIPKHILEKANVIISSIIHGQCYTHFKGKRLQRNRSIISIPLNNKYRILLNETSNFTNFQILSHASYNRRAKSWK